MLHDVEQQDVVKTASIQGKLAAIQVTLNKLVQVGVLIGGKLVNAGDAALLGLQRLRDITAGAADIGDRRTGAHPLQSQAMGTLKIKFRAVESVVLGGRANVEITLVEHAEILGAAEQGGAEHVASVFDALHVADLIAVIDGNGQLLQAQAGAQELDEDFGVEMIVVGVALERQAGQGRY